MLRRCPAEHGFQRHARHSPEKPGTIGPAALIPIPPRWVLINMIATVDGATAVDGRSGGLGGAADKAVFAGVRALANVILAGAGTVQ